MSWAPPPLDQWNSTVTVAVRGGRSGVDVRSGPRVDAVAIRAAGCPDRRLAPELLLVAGRFGPPLVGRAVCCLPRGGVLPALPSSQTVRSSRAQVLVKGSEPRGVVGAEDPLTVADEEVDAEAPRQVRRPSRRRSRCRRRSSRAWSSRSAIPPTASAGRATRRRCHRHGQCGLPRIPTSGRRFFLRSERLGFAETTLAPRRMWLP
jgi:hypothetical protein